MRSAFHLAYHVTDLESSRRFYGDILGCREGRSTDTWVDFDFFGHQISLHLGTPFAVTRTGKVGDHMVMMPHLGVVLPLDDWFALADRLRQRKSNLTSRRSFALPANRASSAQCSSSIPAAIQSKSRVSVISTAYSRAEKYTHHRRHHIPKPQTERPLNQCP